MRQPLLTIACAAISFAIFGRFPAVAETPQPTSRPAATDGWKTIDARGQFSFTTPPDLKFQEVQGIDSYVGLYVSPTLRVGFDHGQYSSPLDEIAEKPGAVSNEETIHGRKARIVTDQHTVYVYFAKTNDDANNHNKLELDVEFKDPATLADAMAIIRSIQFPAVAPKN